MPKLMAKKLFHGTIFLTIANMTQRLGTVVLLFVISRWLDAAQLGIYASAMAYFGLLSMACTLGAKSYLVREIAQSPDDTGRYLLHFGTLGGMLAVGVTALCWVGVGWVPLSAEVAHGLQIVSFALLPAVLNTTVRTAFIAHQRVGNITIAQFVLTVLQIGISILLLWWGAQTEAVLIAVVVGQCATLAISMLLLRPITHFTWRLEWARLWQMAYEVRTFALLSLLSGLFAQPEVLLLTFLSTDAETGYFSAAFKLITLWLIVPQVTMTNVFPLLSRAYRDSDPLATRLQNLSIKYLLVLCLPIAAGMMAAAEPIIRLLYGAGFEQAVRPLQLMALMVPLNALIDVFWRVLAARNEQHLDLRVRIVMVIARLGGGYWLIAQFGIEGAALSAVLSLMLTAVLLGRYVRHDGTRLPVLSVGWRSGVAAMVMGGAIWWVVPRTPLVFVVLAGMMIYSVLMWVGGAFSADEVNKFMTILRPKRSNGL